MSSTSLLTSQPGKSIYLLVAFVLEVVRVPFWLVKYLFRAGRPHRRWTFRQAAAVRIVRAFLSHCAKVHLRVPLSLKPGGERDQFVVVDPPKQQQHQHQQLFVGPTLLLPERVKPQSIGATWYPRRPSKEDLTTATVLLHFHGGAFVLGDGRTQDCGYFAHNMIKHAGLPFVFCPQYRLSGEPTDAPFPAALQDAVTSYSYLLREMGVPAERIIISGDSAGGNLAIALLRYIAEYGGVHQLPAPGAAFLWSPWVSPHDSLGQQQSGSNNDDNGMAAQPNPNVDTDYVSDEFGLWGASKYIPSHLQDREKTTTTTTTTVTPTDQEAIAIPYISSLGRPFETPTPLFVSAGELEILLMDDTRFAKEMSAEGNAVELDVQPLAPHDYALIGNILGMDAQARDSAVKAGEWSRRVVKHDA